MTIQTTTQYAAQVRQALADLPPAIFEELLEDLDEHLAEVAAESGGDLGSTLGAPQAYARELRRAAGLPPGPELANDSAPAWVRAKVDHMLASDPGQATLAFLPELRPAWWVLRAWLAVVALSFVTGIGSVLLPFGLLLSVPVLAAAIVLSVRLGRWAQARPVVDPRQRLLTVAGNATLALVALFVLVGVGQSGTGNSYAGPGYVDPQPTLARADGTPITNLYPYSTDGQPLSGVLLYDQDGRSVDNLSTNTFEGQEIVRALTPGQPPPPSNSYPQAQQVRSYDGPEPTLLPLPGPALPTPSAEASPSATPSPSPTALPRPSPAASASASPGATAPAAGPSPTR